MLYVGDGDAEGTGAGEVACPFWDVGGSSEETEGGVLEGTGEAFPSSLEGCAANTSCRKIA
jgi:hypothetical protein